MDKVHITKNEARSIESYLEHNSRKELLDGKLRGNVLTGSWCYINSMDFDTLAKALYVGYELKKEPEDKVKERYDKARREYMRAGRHTKDEVYSQGLMHGIRGTLNDLGITIEGVND